jgi:hypothetical protein
MSWFKNKLRNWLINDTVSHETVAHSEYMSIDSDGMRFKILPADGGFVAEFRVYDSIKDRYHTRLHIIPSDQDLGQRMGQIITMEVLRNS